MKNQDAIDGTNSLQDTELLKRMLFLQEKQNQALELLASGHEIDPAIHHLLSTMEDLEPGLSASILKFDATSNKLHDGWAPNLPAAYRAAIDGVTVGPTVGSCGAAAFSKSRVIVADISKSPLWEAFKEFALGFNLRACWSEPIFGSDNNLLGTFALYYNDIRNPSEFELQAIQSAAHLAGIALQREINRARAKELEAQLLHAQKMTAIGNLAGGIAHDLNNTLTAITGHLELVLLKPESRKIVEKHVLLSLDGCQQAAALIQQVLGFAQQGKYKPELVSVHELIESGVDFASSITTCTVEKTTSISKLDTSVFVDTVQLKQVFTNLLFNAAEASDTNSLIKIHSEVIYSEDPQIYNKNATPGEYLSIRITDTGTGISGECLSKIFDPFFTTKTESGGTGLGLSMVYGTVQNHGGWISVESEVGVGTTFTVHLPLANKGATDDAAIDSCSSADSSERNTILVIDDEAPIVSIVEEYLTASGLSVTGFTDPALALSWYQEHWKEVDLVLLDIKMPVLDGTDCFNEIRRVHPAARIIVTSGYSLDDSVQNLLSCGALTFFQKPFKMKYLANWIIDFLDTQSTANTDSINI